MGKLHTISSKLLSFLFFIIALFCWVCFAPANIGGNTTYAILRGNSMYSEFKQGDLVLVHTKSSYEVGDIVLYKNPDIGSVFHRIIGIDGNKFFLKGDKNSWVDSFQPTAQDIYGSLWIHLSYVGYFLKYFRSPTIFSFIITFSCLFIGQVFSSDQNKVSLNVRLKKKNASFLDKSRISKMTYKLTDWLYFFLVLLLCAIILSFVSFSKPIEQTISDDIVYTKKGNFEYFAITPDDIYKEGYLESGDTVFRLLTDSLNIVFLFQLEANNPTQMNGTFQLFAEISDANGWTYPIELNPAVNFTGTKYTATSILELNQIQEIIDNFEKQTGENYSTYYLNIKPEIHLNGVIAQRTFEDDFSPSLTFAIDELSMKLPHQNDDVLTNLLNPSSQGIINGTKITANTVSVLGIDFNVLFLRMASVYGIIFSLGFLTWFGIKYFRTQKQDEVTKVKMLYGITFIDVKDGSFLLKNAVEIENLKDLAIIAAQEQTSIYHYQQNDLNHYYVISQNSADIIYHYQVRSNFNQKEQ